MNSRLWWLTVAYVSTLCCVSDIFFTSATVTRGFNAFRSLVIVTHGHSGSWIQKLQSRSSANINTTMQIYSITAIQKPAITDV